MSAEILKEFFEEAVRIGEKVIDEVGPSLIQPISEYLDNHSDEITDTITNAFESVVDILGSIFGG